MDQCLVEPAVLQAALIDLDATYLVQLGMFLVLYILLRTFFFKPYIDVLKARDESTAGLKKRAADMVTHAVEAERAAEEKLTHARAEAVLIRRKLAEDGARMRDGIVARERARMDEELARELAALDLQKKEFMGRVDSLASDVASLIESQVRQAEGRAP